MKRLTTFLFVLLGVLLYSSHLYAENQFIVVKANDVESFLDALAKANETNRTPESERFFILLPNGTYDLGERVLTTINGYNISIIGQSMEGTIIKNAPKYENEGISKTGTLLNRSTGLYLQDLTLQNALDYYHSGYAGRAVTLHDKGNETICKRVRLLSYQDTYYSDTEESHHYFEDSEIHGTVDFICGAGDVYFNRCLIVTEPRSADGKGRDVIAAPRTSKTQWGYVFEGCTIKNVASTFQYGRGWHTLPRMAMLNTTLLTPENLEAPRYDSNGMRTVESLFYEYHTMDAEGRDITPATNVVTFTLKDQSREHETILSKQEAKKYRLKKIFPNWRPEKVACKLEKQSRQLMRRYVNVDGFGSF
jgi:pectin methylesterase-like acyl-CoA thioesterase